jgi:hypothetical protein
VNLFYPILADFSVEISEEAVKVEESGSKGDRFYDFVLHRFRGSEDKGTSVATCIFSAGKKINDKKTIEIKATYFVGVNDSEALSEGDRKHLLEELASSSAWSMFRSAFAQIASQTGLELPLLPNVPKLRWLDEKKGAKPKSKPDVEAKAE